MIQGYVVGFVIHADGPMLLLKKARPAWQKGRLNGVGGHIEPGETPLTAMEREFAEEIGRPLDGTWVHTSTLHVKDEAVVYFYKAEVSELMKYFDGKLVRSNPEETRTLTTVREALSMSDTQIMPSARTALCIAIDKSGLAHPVTLYDNVGRTGTSNS